ncbi:unnamed protein product [Urochloa humidicola]
MEEAFRHAATTQPNYPTLQITRFLSGHMIKYDLEQQVDNRNFIVFPVQVLAFRDIGFCFNLTNFPSLERVTAHIKCEHATHGEVQDAEAALRRAVDVHPNHPAIEMGRYNEDEMEEPCSDLEEQILAFS